MPSVGSFLNNWTPLGLASRGANKLFGTPTYGEGVDSVVDTVSGKNGLDTAAAGAREAQAQANALAQLQWERQMQGLQEARGQTQPYLSLYDKIYGTQMAGRQTPVGGMGPGAGGTPPPGAGGMGTQPPPGAPSFIPPAGSRPTPPIMGAGSRVLPDIGRPDVPFMGTKHGFSDNSPVPIYPDYVPHDGQVATGAMPDGWTLTPQTPLDKLLAQLQRGMG